MSYTKGPWTVSETWSQTEGAGYVINEAKCNEYSEEFKANARLIEAAPESHESNVELNKIVRELCACYNHPLPEASLKRSNDAIAKATS